jgi:hypothetical protein
MRQVLLTDAFANTLDSAAPGPSNNNQSVPDIGGDSRQQPPNHTPVHTSADFCDSAHFWINPGFAIVKQGRIQSRGRLNLIGRLQLSASNATASREQLQDDIVQLRAFRVQVCCCCFLFYFMKH